MRSGNWPVDKNVVHYKYESNIYIIINTMCSIYRAIVEGTDYDVVSAADKYYMSFFSTLLKSMPFFYAAFRTPAFKSMIEFNYSFSSSLIFYFFSVRSRGHQSANDMRTRRAA